ncbi:peptidase C15 [Lysinibacillus sp. 2017]|uniref:pyroglutamyl-peptidase I n=1 Tax=unclassified Lysinibacillus TaxID=2636778 RepID=UPI000D529CF7|nr:MULTISPECIES: pyroglutamyl-peptidase I [unclassified Lysinibacillus]AWE06831.1 peptidase C15 [Lysinibacillus sp. 2017]TGN37238.1 pyroglutamyl-peptidase I [Lysinibacillus sp. S2017]
MKKLLLTGFEPFLSNPINPTMDIVTELHAKTIGDYEIIGHVLSVDFTEGPKQFLKHLEEIKPDLVVSLGLAAGNTKITPERVAINIKDGEKDNNGVAYEDAPIVKDGNAAYFSTLPTRAIVNRLNEAGYPAAISNSAGTYLCNNIMYEGLHYACMQENVRSGFIHIPASFELAITHGKIPGWSKRDLLTAIEICLAECIKND